MNPKTGERWLEELSFEVVHEQSRRQIEQRAAMLADRGVRRIFAIFVKRGQVAEWQAVEGKWRTLGRDRQIEDEVLEQPLPVRALLEAAAADRAVAEALLAKGEPFLQEAMERREARGRHQDELALVQRQLTRRLGWLSRDHKASIDRLSREALETLSEALLDFRTEVDFEAWLKNHPGRG